MPGDKPVKATTRPASTQRDDMLKAVLERDPAFRANDGTLPARTVPPAAEWIDLADAGPYIDETKMPLYTPNGDGKGGKESSDNDETKEWWKQSLERIAEDRESDQES